jgi:hypothetical protein
MAGSSGQQLVLQWSPAEEKRVGVVTRHEKNELVATDRTAPVAKASALRLQIITHSTPAPRGAKQCQTADVMPPHRSSRLKVSRALLAKTQGLATERQAIMRRDRQDEALVRPGHRSMQRHSPGSMEFETGQNRRGPRPTELTDCYCYEFPKHEILLKI